MSVNIVKLMQYMALLEKLAPIIGNVLDRLGISDKHDTSAILPVPPPLAPVVPVDPAPPVPATAEPVIPQNKPRALRNVHVKIQKAERPARVGGTPGDLYPNPQGMVDNNEAFNYEAILWPDATAYDQDGNEFQGDALISSGLAYRARHEFRNLKTGQVSFIQAEGMSPSGEPVNWQQDTSGGVKFGQRSWLDSVGMNPRSVFFEEGEWEVQVFLNGVASNVLHIRTS